jgi:hypothetical protein
MEVLINELLEDGTLESGSSTMWDDTDGCMKQYRSGTAMFLLSYLAHVYDITIDRAIGAPSHGKDVVDGLNAMDKQFLKWLFRAIAEAGSNEDKNERKIAAHSMTNEGVFSLAEHAAKKLGSESRALGIKGNRKNRKREQNAKMKKRTYHVQDDKDVKHRALKKVATGFEKGTHNGVMGHYNIRADPQLGLGCVMVRRVPCACLGCPEQLKQKWIPSLSFEQQPRYKASVTCENRNMFNVHNDWQLITLVDDKKKSCPEANFEVHEEVLEAITKRLAKKVVRGGYGAVATDDDPDADGYYVLQWDSYKRILKQDLHVSDEEVIKKGKLVVDGTYLNKVPRAKQWYTKGEPGNLQDLKTTVRMRNVVIANLELTRESMGKKLPRTCNVASARRLGAYHVSNAEHDRISDEISRRDRLAFDAGELSDDELQSEEELEEEEESDEEEQE